MHIINKLGPNESDALKKNPIGSIHMEFNTRYCMSCLNTYNGYDQNLGTTGPAYILPCKPIKGYFFINIFISNTNFYKFLDFNIFFIMLLIIYKYICKME